MRGRIWLVACAVGTMALLRAAPAGPVDSGNDMALQYSSAKEQEQKALQKEFVDKLFFFRYLRIQKAEKTESEGRRQIRMSTVEPSSDMVVDFTVVKAESLKKVEPLKEGDAVAVTGRVKSIGEATNTIVLDPVIVRYQDQLAPKAGRQLLYEVDSKARKGTDTSTGKEIVIKEGQ